MKKHKHDNSNLVKVIQSLANLPRTEQSLANRSSNCSHVNSSITEVITRVNGSTSNRSASNPNMIARVNYPYPNPDRNRHNPYRYIFQKLYKLVNEAYENGTNMDMCCIGIIPYQVMKNQRAPYGYDMPVINRAIKISNEQIDSICKILNVNDVVDSLTDLEINKQDRLNVQENIVIDGLMNSISTFGSKTTDFSLNAVMFYVAKLCYNESYSITHLSESFPINPQQIRELEQELNQKTPLFAKNYDKVATKLDKAINRKCNQYADMLVRDACTKSVGVIMNNYANVSRYRASQRQHLRLRTCNRQHTNRMTNDSDGDSEYYNEWTIVGEN